MLKAHDVVLRHAQVFKGGAGGDSKLQVKFHPKALMIQNQEPCRRGWPGNRLASAGQGPKIGNLRQTLGELRHVQELLRLTSGWSSNCPDPEMEMEITHIGIPMSNRLFPKPKFLRL